MNRWESKTYFDFFLRRIENRTLDQHYYGSCLFLDSINISEIHLTTSVCFETKRYKSWKMYPEPWVESKNDLSTVHSCVRTTSTNEEKKSSKQFKTAKVSAILGFLAMFESETSLKIMNKQTCQKKQKHVWNKAKFLINLKI